MAYRWSAWLLLLLPFKQEYREECPWCFATVADLKPANIQGEMDDARLAISTYQIYL